MGRRPSVKSDLKKAGKGKKIELMNTSKKRPGRPPSSAKFEENERRYPKRIRTSIDALNLQLTEESFEVHDDLIKPVDYFRSKVAVSINANAVSLLKEKLSKKQLEMFRQTCFGHFLEMEYIVCQPQLLHSLLLREVSSNIDSELWIRIDGVRLKFSIDEFALITGLKCNGDASKMNLSGDGNRLLDKYFGGAKKVSKQFISECFMYKRWESDEDAVKIAVLFFVHLFLLSTVPDKPVNSIDFELVDSGLYNDYPWGRDVFGATIESLKERFVGKHHKGDGDKVRKPSMYRLLGFPLAFQVWFYECCPFVNGKYAVFKHSKVPRILNWFASEQPTYKSLQRNLFGVSNKKLKLKNITPTVEEKKKLDLGGMFIEEKGKGIFDETEEDDDYDKYFNYHPDRTWASHENVSFRASHSLKEEDIRRELTSLSVGQLEINRQITSLKSYLDTNFAKVFGAISAISQKLDLGGNIQDVNVFHETVPMLMGVGAQDADFGKDVHDGADHDDRGVNFFVDEDAVVHTHAKDNNEEEAVPAHEGGEGAKESDSEKHVRDGVGHDEMGVHHDVDENMILDLPINDNNEEKKSKDDELEVKVVDMEVKVNEGKDKRDEDDVCDAEARAKSDEGGAETLVKSEGGGAETLAKSDEGDDGRRNCNG